MSADQSKRNLDLDSGNGQCKRSRTENGNDSTRLSINSRYMKEELLKCLREEFRKGSMGSSCSEPPCDSGHNLARPRSASKKLIHSSPFVHCVLPEFIREDHCLDRLQGELQEVNFNEKNNDLYNFHQSADLRQYSGPQITALRKLFYTDILQWMKKVTDIELNGVVDLFCSIYEYTDILLCHDDELQGRRIAFILYLVPPWTASDGGSLDLFNINESYQPDRVVKSVLPAWNQFTFFEVSPKSFHQVSEVLSKDKTRLSVSGWFHGPDIPRPPPPPISKLPLLPSFESETGLLFEWVNPSYLDLEVQSEIREKFELESEIQLQDFLKPHKYSAMNEAFQQNQLEWLHQGPANRRNYYVANENTFPDIVRECLRLLQSEIMFLLLSNLTGLKMHKEAAVSDDDNDKNHKRSHKKLNEVRNHKNASRLSNSSAPVENSNAICQQSTSDSSGCTDRRPQTAPTSADISTTSEGPSAQVKDSKTMTHETAHKNKETDSKATAATKATKASCSQEIRMWTHGCYTLLQDTDAKTADYALDALLFFGCEGWQPDYGGYVSYIVKGEDEELLTVSPAHNSLALVYRDRDTLRFVKHVNHQITQMPFRRFFDISFIYYE